jgi:hypothetical protein
MCVCFIMLLGKTKKDKTHFDICDAREAQPAGGVTETEIPRPRSSMADNSVERRQPGGEAAQAEVLGVVRLAGNSVTDRLDVRARVEFRARAWRIMYGKAEQWRRTV